MITGFRGKISRVLGLGFRVQGTGYSGAFISLDMLCRKPMAQP